MRANSPLLITIVYVSLGVAPCPIRAGALPPGATIFADSGPFELYVVPQMPVSGLLPTVVGVRAKDPAHRIDSLRRLSITGDVHQTWAREPDFGEVIQKTPFRKDSIEFPEFPQPTCLSSWAFADTHLIPACPSQVDSIVTGSLIELNDFADPLMLGMGGFGTLDGLVDNYIPMPGIGDLYMPNPSDSIAIVPNSRSQIDVAYIVTRASVSPVDPGGAVFLSLEVLGRDAEGLPLALTGQFGLGPEGPLSVPFVPEPSPAGLLALAAAFAMLRFRHRVTS
jgi:hypothetical protein